VNRLANAAVTLLAGVPPRYALHVRGGRLSRLSGKSLPIAARIPASPSRLRCCCLSGFHHQRVSSPLRGCSRLTGHVICHHGRSWCARDGGVLEPWDIRRLDEGGQSLVAAPWRRFRDVIIPNGPGREFWAGSLMW